MKTLVVGGAGFIGSHLVKRLALTDHQPIVLDNLRSGFADAARYGQLIQGDAGDAATVSTVPAQQSCDAVMNFASHTARGVRDGPRQVLWQQCIGDAGAVEGYP